MLQLNFPDCDFKIKSKENKYFIFDIVRKKYVHLTKEEWVRQHAIHYLAHVKQHPVSLMAVEKQLAVYGLAKRTDIVVYTTEGKPFLIVECKAPEVRINQDTFDQIARYNLEIDAEFLMVTNGLDHFYCRMDHHAKTYQFLEDLPAYKHSPENN
jgi:type I site-specific restriction endonuclease